MIISRCSDPALLYEESPVKTERRRRSVLRGMYRPNIAWFTFVRNLCTHGSKEIGTTIFSAPRLQITVLMYFIFGLTLTLVYALVIKPNSSDDPTSEWDINAMKDYADLCITGLIYLLGTYLALSLGRWWAVRTQCCGALHQSLSFLCMYAASVWPTSSKSDRQARELIARLSLATYQLLFIEARAAELQENDHYGLTKAVRAMVGAGTLLPEEADVLEHMPNKAEVALSWLAAFWEEVLGKSSSLECATAFSTPNAGRYALVFGKLAAAKDAISLTHFYNGTHLPYGLINLLQFIVHMTCITNTIFSGVHLGTTIRNHHPAHSLIWLGIVRFCRVCLLPLLLDGVLLVARVIALPMGLDRDDFRAGAHLEYLEDSCLAPGAAVERYHPAFSKTNAMIKKGEGEEAEQSAAAAAVEVGK